MRLFSICFLLLSVLNVFSQENITSENTQRVKIDSLYREDQFYFGFTFNVLQNKPVGLSQSNLSTGLSAGFLRDMPINKTRTVAIASGIGVTYNSYNQNLSIYKSGQTTFYSIIQNNIGYDKNKFSQLLIDVPLEFRWRTSTYESHKFWRIYGGLKMTYVALNKSTFVDGNNKIVVSNNKDFNKILYGVYVSAGYNTWNVYAYYGLNPIFKSAKINTENVDINALNIGIIFYIL
ncbi:porin family protein [Flavobacterium sp.]|uniref:porin family protein n=1 Tax=Flavobacterium sp. TaxID=239 RepID=UPI00286C7ECA|nr:porin family protein [Flavobacterium sp.]